MGTKLTTARLRQIIKEELSRAMNEMDMGMMGEKPEPTPEQLFDRIMYYYELDPGSDVGGMPVDVLADEFNIDEDKAFRLLYQASGITKDGMTISPNRKGNLFFVVPAR